MILIMFNGVMSGSQVPLDERALDDTLNDTRWKEIKEHIIREC